ncbi:MAG: excinuclease subunit, partial [Nocardioidaceae bacterium]|nr:excinuclease subunit [Nocardioidaceae bacterium]
DIRKLLHVLSQLVDQGNTVIVIEHNLDVIKTADWLIDLGPDGGNKGGLVVAEGTPEEVTRVEASYTGRFLEPVLRGRGRSVGAVPDSAAPLDGGPVAAAKASRAAKPAKTVRSSTTETSPTRAKTTRSSATESVPKRAKTTKTAATSTSKRAAARR